MTRVVVTAALIINRFLYGQDATPGNLLDDDLIRDPLARSSVTVDRQSYMEAIGRFAPASQYELVQKFFSYLTDLAPNRDPLGNIVPYTAVQLAECLGVDNYLLVRQFMHDDGRGDYALRTLIWNSGGFGISDQARFWVTADGARYIQNLAVVPLSPEDFDLKSSSFLTDVANSLYLSERIDPFGIGRVVDIQFEGGLTLRSHYGRDEYADDQTYVNSWTIPISSSFESVSDDIRARAVTILAEIK